MKKLVLGLVIVTALAGMNVCARAAVQAGADQKFVETTGTGKANPAISNVTQRRAEARDAAVVEARYKMAGILQSNAAAKGARIVKTEWAPDDSCTVTLRLNR